MAISCDIVVLGGGPAGYAAALRAANEKAKVCLIEGDKLGGTCLNRGCIPTKCFYHSTREYQRLKSRHLPEITFDNLKLDYPKMLERKDKAVDTLRGGLAELLKKLGVKVMNGRGFLKAKGSVIIKEGEQKGEEIVGGIVLIATGSSPGSLPFIPKDPRIHTTDSIWDLKEAPKHLLIIGGGVIGIEAAGIYSSICESVTVVEILPDILANVKSSFRRVVVKSLEKKKVNILKGTKITSIKPSDKCIEVSLDGRDNLYFDTVLVAVGRKPNVEGVFDEDLKISLKQGAIEVGCDMQTSVKGVYAAGDVIGNPMLAHVASREALVAVNRGLGFDKEDKIDFGQIPEVIFSDPEIAQIGYFPESVAKKEEGIKVGRFPYVTSSKAVCDNDTEGFAELVFDEKKNAIVGGGIVGANASDLIGEVILAVGGGISPHTLERCIHPHPTLTEIIWEASADTIGKAIYKMRMR